MTNIYFAPLQGFTDDAYRRIHARLAGGVTTYYTPFIRMEPGGLRSKDIRDLKPEFNEGVDITPQIIASNKNEFSKLADAIKDMGYKKVDLNMGCPFPLQTRHGRGAGLLQHPEIVEEIIAEMEKRADTIFSVKMRIGQETEEEGQRIIRLLNNAKLNHIVLHPRLGIQQYKGKADKEAFKRFMNETNHPIIYNGDISTLEEIRNIETEIPTLKGIMIGRGLLARPSLATEYKEENEWEPRQRLSLVKEMHTELLEHYSKVIPSEMQRLTKIRTFWEHMENEIGRKQWKKIIKAGNMKNYLKAVAEL
ncbi:MAG: tRNA-dihydrouridine synthase family protein [Bacteroidaceae bacterium]|nr:tRNA-dihydrouridine synthase family protein [Bacteroidaceae bacterium]